MKGDTRSSVKGRLVKVLLGVVGLAIGVLGVLSLREATLSTHGRVDRDSQVEIVLQAESNRAEPNQTLPEMVDALLLTCRLEVSSDPIVMLDAALQEAAKGAGVELSIEDGAVFIGY